ncbi:MAG: glycoside hydrolase family 99-like domain-containing protein, partial [Tannerella sp.]|nr:glycoside hydrolase family 99-like domain-containing protein [Tannerella sp.]
RPWEGPKGLSNQRGDRYYTDGTPEQFKNYLNNAIDWMNANPKKTTKEKIILLYAWNELGEGGYLVPTKADPEAAKLKEIKEVVSK